MEKCLNASPIAVHVPYMCACYVLLCIIELIAQFILAGYTVYIRFTRWYVWVLASIHTIHEKVSLQCVFYSILLALHGILHMCVIVIAQVLYVQPGVISLIRALGVVVA